MTAGSTNATQDRDQLHVAVLPHHELVLLQIAHVLVSDIRAKLEHQPADMGVEKALRDIVRILVVIDVLVMRPMFAAPHERGVFKGAGPEKQREESYGPMGVEREMRKKPMVAQRDREPARAEHYEKQHHLKPIQPVKIQIYAGTAVSVRRRVPIRKELVIQLTRAKGMRENMGRE